MVVDADFPGGNIIVEKIEGSTITVRQDPRDTKGFWFYWYCRVKGCSGRDLRFVFTDGEVIGVRGPAVSLDGGKSWKWLHEPRPVSAEFAYSCPSGVDEVRFCFAIPYVQSNLDAFLSRYPNHPSLRRQTLCKTLKGRDAEWLTLGRLRGRARYRVLLTARHHCCEMMANYVLEGAMESVVSPNALGSWYRDNVLMDVVPFVDKDGVEQGDQGKNRRPRDHGRDYADTSIYPETAEIRRRWLDDDAQRPHVIFDLHCPYIAGNHNEHAYFVGNKCNWTELEVFSPILERTCGGPLPFYAANNLPFGQAWNTGANYVEGRSLAAAAQGLPGVRLAASLEIPYANCEGVEVTPEACRAFGRDLAKSIRSYFEL